MIDHSQLNAIAFIFEQENGVEHSLIEAEEIEASGLGSVSLEQLERELKSYIEMHLVSDADKAQTAIWALSKCGNISNVDFLNSVLERTYNSNIQCAYQTMIALDNLGKTILGHSSSMLDEAENYEKAKCYLQSIA